LFATSRISHKISVSLILLRFYPFSYPAQQYVASDFFPYWREYIQTDSIVIARQLQNDEILRSNVSNFQTCNTNNAWDILQKEQLLQRQNRTAALLEKITARLYTADSCMHLQAEFELCHSACSQCHLKKFCNIQYVRKLQHFGIIYAPHGGSM
jgi:hypothetical protein